MSTFSSGGEGRNIYIFRPFRRLRCASGGGGTYFVFWNLHLWFQYRVGELVSRLRVPIVVRNEQGVRANRAHDEGRNGHFAAPRTHGYPVAILYAKPGSCLLVDFHPGIRCLLFQERRTSCLVAGEIVIDDAPRCEYQRVFFIRFLGRRNVRDRMEARLAIGKTETLLVEARRSG